MKNRENNYLLLLILYILSSGQYVSKVESKISAVLNLKNGSNELNNEAIFEANVNTSKKLINSRNGTYSNDDIKKMVNNSDLLNNLIHTNLMDHIVNETVSQIDEFKTILTLNNNSEYNYFENKFNDTYSRYKEEVVSILANFNTKKKGLFKNIDYETQQKLLQLIKGNNTWALGVDRNIENKREIEYTPINYIDGLDLNKWNDMLDSSTSLSLSLLNNKPIGIKKSKINGYLIREEIIDLSRKLDNLLILVSDIIQKQNCEQIAWSLIYDDEDNTINNYSWVVKKQLKKYQSSNLLLSSKKSSIINKYNSIVSRTNILESNIKGLLDVLVNARSNNLQALVTVEDIYRDILSLREYSLNLNKEHIEWLKDNIKLIKPLVNWFEVTITILYKITLDILRSIIASKIRNISDFIKTLKEDLGEDLLKMESLSDASIKFFEHSINSLSSNVLTLRNDLKSEIFLNVFNKLYDHHEYLKNEYKVITHNIVNIVLNNFEGKSDQGNSYLKMLNYYENLLNHSKDILKLLWDQSILNPFKFKKNSEYHLSKIHNLFKQISQYLNSELVLKSSNLDNSISRMRYIGEMLFPDFIHQMDILKEELEKYHFTGKYDEDILNSILNGKYVNNYINKCNFIENNRYVSNFNHLNHKNSMWKSEKVLIQTTTELENISIDYLLNKAKSLLINYYEYRNKPNDRHYDVIVLNDEYFKKLGVIKEKLVILKTQLEKRIKEKEFNINALLEEKHTKSIAKINKYIDDIDIVSNNLQNIDQVKIENVIRKSKEILEKYGYKLVQSSEFKNDKRVEKNTQISKSSEYRHELERYKKNINKYIYVIKKITNYNFDIKVLEEHIEMIEKYLDHLEGQIYLYCNRLNKDNSKISRSLYILKYVIMKKRPDTQCERLILDFSSSKNNVSDLIKESNEVVNEFLKNVNLCKEIQDITRNYKEILSDYQKTKENIDNLSKITSIRSFNEGISIIIKNLGKLSQKSKLISKELLCYVNSISGTDVTTYTNDIKKEIFKLQNTIEKEISDSMYN